ncbi:hypothetical protein, partial [Streptomyces achromogenes]|uniref:hypothetical protein n=1 Tax=Streptomyces achromogenes TaxID=67255 RepID=UPI00343E46CA
MNKVAVPAVARPAGVVVLGQQAQVPVQEEIGTGVAGPGDGEQAAGDVDGDDGRRAGQTVAGRAGGTGGIVAVLGAQP